MTTYPDKSKHLKELHELTVQIEGCIRSISRMDDTPSKVAKDNLSRIFNEKLSEFIDKSFLAGQKAMVEQARKALRKDRKFFEDEDHAVGGYVSVKDFDGFLQTQEDTLK